MITSIRKHASQDELVESFAMELAALEPAPVVQETVLASTFVDFVIKCAAQLEGVGVDASVADEVLAEIETEL